MAAVCNGVVFIRKGGRWLATAVCVLAQQYIHPTEPLPGFGWGRYWFCGSAGYAHVGGL